jgi:bifunctional non-homologous end joining protein LigD
MPLDTYRAKRDFTKTPEPAGRAQPRKGGPPFFGVQKHLASHLHYDLRLEHRGVLMSWAVPKGPSLDPGERRLAIQVEDHPLEYGTFEGVIPEGYGAGIVLLWDEGRWEPEVDDVDAALKKGNLKFRLNGYKLKGSWVLVRTRGNDGRAWLLIKHRDEWAGPVDVTQFTQSVKSGGDFADILAQNQPEVWLSNRPARGGETGALFQRIIEKALALKAEREAKDEPKRKPKTRTVRSAKPKRPAKRKPGPPARRKPKKRLKA